MVVLTATPPATCYRAVSYVDSTLHEHTIVIMWRDSDCDVIWLSCHLSRMGHNKVFLVSHYNNNIGMSFLQ